MTGKILAGILFYLLSAAVAAGPQLAITYHSVAAESRSDVFTQQIVVMVSNQSDQAVRNLTLTSVTDQPDFEQRVFIGDLPAGESLEEITLKSVPAKESIPAREAYGQAEMTWVASYEQDWGMQDAVEVRARSYQSRSFGN